MGRGARASQRTQGRLRLDRDVHIPVRYERERETDQPAVLERSERPQRIDADVAVAIAEQRPDAGDHLGRSDLGAVAQGARHARQRDGAHVRLGIGERAEQRRNGARDAQTRERVDRVGARRGIGVAGEVRQASDRRAGAEAPRLEERNPLHRGRADAGRHLDVEQVRYGARPLLPADLREGGDRLALRRAVPRAGERRERRDGAPVFEQPQRERGGRLHGRARVPQGGDERRHGGRVAAPAGRQGRLPPHERVGRPEGLALEPRIEDAGIRGGQETRERLHRSLVALGRGEARREQQHHEQHASATGEPGPVSARAGRIHAREGA